MTWFKRESSEVDNSGEKTIRTEGLWVKCEDCRQIIWKKDLEENFNCCPKCEKHFRIDARTRLAYLLDEGEYETDDDNLVSIDPLKFVDLKAYSSRITTARRDTGLNDAVINARGKLNGRPVIVSAMEYSFIGGSMGAVVGEMITRAVERATDARTPLVVVSASGGARRIGALAASAGKRDAGLTPRRADIAGGTGARLQALAGSFCPRLPTDDRPAAAPLAARASNRACPGPTRAQRCIARRRRKPMWFRGSGSV